MYTPSHLLHEGYYVLPLIIMCMICFQTHTSSAHLNLAVIEWPCAKCVRVSVWMVNEVSVRQGNRLVVGALIMPANDHNHVVLWGKVVGWTLPCPAFKLALPPTQLLPTATAQGMKELVSNELRANCSGYVRSMPNTDTVPRVVEP